MSTPTPQKFQLTSWLSIYGRHCLFLFVKESDYDALRAELATEREKVRVLREALDEAQSCGGLTGAIFMQARAALAATEGKP